MTSAKDRIVGVLERRLPALSKTIRSRLAEAYLSGVQRHAIERTVGVGSVPTNLSMERAELMAFVCRDMGRILTEDEIGALLRIVSSAARSISKTMLAVFDDLPLLTLKAAFDKAKREGRGSQGEIEDGYRVQFMTEERMELARTEIERRGLLCEIMEVSGTRHVLLIDPVFNINEVFSE